MIVIVDQTMMSGTPRVHVLASEEGSPVGLEGKGEKKDPPKTEVAGEKEKCRSTQFEMREEDDAAVKRWSEGGEREREREEEMWVADGRRKVSKVSEGVGYGGTMVGGNTRGGIAEDQTERDRAS